MKPSSRKSSEGAITLLEVLVVIVIIVVLALMMLPPLKAAKRGAQRQKCAGNLKQVGLAFRIFAEDNHGKYPFEATNSIAFQRTSNAWMHFQAMSNELGSAKILMCPADRERWRNAAVDFSNTTTGLMWPTNQDLSLGYFVGLGAGQGRPQSILTGDRCVARSESNALYSSFTYGGASQVTTTSTWLPLLHNVVGNIVLSDGSVKQAISRKQLGEQLQTAMGLYGNTNNYFLFPQ